MPLIKRGAVALGRGACASLTGVRIADDVLSGQNIKTAAKRRVTEAGRTMLRGLVIPGVRRDRKEALQRRDSARDRRPRNVRPTYSTTMMAFVHIQSCEGVKSELDLFTVSPT